MIREIIKNYIIIGLIMIIIDGFYLTIIGKPVFSKTVYKIQNSPLVMKIVPAIMTYILLVIVLDYFIIKEKKNPIDAFILGLCIYGVFDFTNMAIFKNYTIKTALIDTLWGGILFYIITSIVYKLKL